MNFDFQIMKVDCVCKHTSNVVLYLIFDANKICKVFITKYLRLGAMLHCYRQSIF